MKDIYGHVYLMREQLSVWDNALLLYLLLFMTGILYVSVGHRVFQGLGTIYRSSEGDFNRFLLENIKQSWSVILSSAFLIVLSLSIFACGISREFFNLGEEGFFNPLFRDFSLAFVCYFLVHMLVIELVFTLFFSTQEKNLLWALHFFSLVLMALVSAFLVILLIGKLPLFWRPLVYLLFFGLYIVRCLLIFRGIKRILGERFLYRYMILYLCAAEIVPVFWCFYWL